MNCYGETEEKAAVENEKKLRKVSAGKREDSAGHDPNGGHGGCGMHGGGFMKWLWIALLVYLAASFLIK